MEIEVNGKEEPEGFYQKYEPRETLGTGLQSVVRRCIHKATGDEYAVKIVDKYSEKGESMKGIDVVSQIRAEIAALSRVAGHPNIIKLVDAFESSAFFFLVFELAEGGELFDYLTEVVTIPEKEARKITFQILMAVAHMHSLSIVHRDLKPENILLNKDQRVVVSDFGFAAELKDGDALRELCGTPGYLAPEVLKCSMYENMPGYGKEVDLWACGVILYTLLVGFAPFWHRRQITMLRNIMEGKYTFGSPEWDDISEGPKDLIGMLVQALDPDMKRWAEAKAIEVGEKVKVTWLGYAKRFDCFLRKEELCLQI